MKQKEIKELIKIVEESNIDELEVSRWWKRVRIRKNINNNHSPNILSSDMIQSGKDSINLEIAKNMIKEKTAEREDNTFEVKSPMVGTFYRAPAPEADPYVKEGDIVKKGQTLCVIEAMKLMNGIEAEKDGKIVKIIPQNSQPVEYNQTLFIMSDA